MSYQIGIAIDCPPALQSLANLPGADAFASCLLFRLVQLELEHADLIAGVSLWYGPASAFRAIFTVSDIPAGLRCVQQAIGSAAAGALPGVLRILWQDESEGLWRGTQGAPDMLDGEFWDDDAGTIFHGLKVSEAANLGELAEIAARAIRAKQAG